MFIPAVKMKIIHTHHFVVAVSFIGGGNWSTRRNVSHSVVSSAPRHGRIRTHNFSGDRH
jgi:hypothetical protein